MYVIQVDGAGKWRDVKLYWHGEKGREWCCDDETGADARSAKPFPSRRLAREEARKITQAYAESGTAIRLTVKEL